MRSGRSVSTTSMVSAQALRRLQRQAVDQVEGHAARSPVRAHPSTACCSRVDIGTRLTMSCTRGSKSCTPMLRRLNPWRRSTSSCSRVVLRGSASIARSASGAERSQCSQQAVEQAVQLAGGQETWACRHPDAARRASAPRAARRCAIQRELAQQRVDIGRGQRMVAHDAHVAAAEGAQRLAERNVHIQRQAARGRACTSAASRSASPALRRRCILPVHDRRIAGVARRWARCAGPAAPAGAGITRRSPAAARRSGAHWPRASAAARRGPGRRSSRVAAPAGSAFTAPKYSRSRRSSSSPGRCSHSGSTLPWMPQRSP